MNERSQKSRDALTRTDRQPAARLQAALERRERQIAAMRRVSEALFGQPNGEAALGQALDVALEVLQAQAGALLLYDAARDELVFTNVAGSRVPALIGQRMPASQGIAGQVLRTGAPDITLHVRQHGGVNPLAGKGDATLITVPLKSTRGEAMGVLQLRCAGKAKAAKEAAFDQGDLEVLQVLAAAAAAAIEAARLTKRARQAEVVSIIGEISHDIKNMLTPIQSGLWTLEAVLEDLFMDLEALRAQSHGRRAEQEIARIAAPARDLYGWICQGAHKSCDQVTARTREIADAVKGELSMPFVEECDLNEVVNAVVHPLLMVAEHANVHLHLDLDHALPRAEFDRKQMYNALYNLINNAIPETPPSGSVTIRTRHLNGGVASGAAHDAATAKSGDKGGDKGGEYLLLEVQDTGRGMPEHVRARLFTDDAISTKVGGTGLGTRIVAGVVRQHNGTIAVQSEPGQGSTFSIRLPLRHRPSAVARVRASGPLPVRRHNLPTATTTLIGRERERNLGREALSYSAVRLLSLVGPAGVGKTRLAVQIAGEVLDDFADGVWFVSLAPVAAAEGPSRVAAVIAATLGVPEEPGRSPAQRLRHWLRPKRLLLVLDNFEQIVAAAPLVGDLLTSCAGLKVLVTSRSALRLRGERELAVPPLMVPPLAFVAVRPTPEEVEELKRYPAIALFVERAAAVRSGFALTPKNARDVTEICLRLDGLPLAIELAAARIKSLAPAALRARLKNHLPLPGRGPQHAPLRHQTLRAAVDWSYDLLAAADQKLLRRMMVFEGGCSSAAAQAVAGEPLDGAPVTHEDDAGRDLAAQLALLVDQSLLRREERLDGGAWYFSLETIREYGLEKLAQSGEGETLRWRHARYYLELAEAARAQIIREPGAPPPPPGLPPTEASPALWRDWREREYGNVRAALRWLLDHARQNCDTAPPHGALRLALTLKNVWGGELWTERREALERALEGDPDAPAVLRLPAMLHLGDLTVLQADYESAAQWGQKCLDLSRSLDDRWGVARALGMLARVAAEEDDLPRAQALFAESLALQRAVDNQGSVAWTLFFLGRVARRAGDPAQARDCFEQALAAFRQMEDKEGIAFALYQLGRSLYDSADPAPARQMLEDSLSAFRERGHKSGVVFVLAFLGEVAAQEGNFALAREQLEESLALSRQLGHRIQIGEALQALGGVALHEGHLAEARVLWQEALALGQSLKNLTLLSTLLHDFARLAAAQGDGERAARLLGASHALAQDAGQGGADGTHLAHRTVTRTRDIAQVRDHLGEAAFAAAHEQGRRLSLDSALAEALQI